MKKSKIFLCILCLIMCCGCWDKHELEDQTFVVMLGIDKAESNDVIVTVAFPLTQAESGGGKGSSETGGDYSVMSVKAPTVVEGLNMFNIKLAGPLSLFSAKTVVISQELAEDDMMRHVFSSWRYEQTRNNTNVIISRCGASEFIEARLKDPVIDPLRQDDLVLEQANYSAYNKSVQFLDLIINMRSGMDGIAMYGGVSDEGGEEAEQDKGNEIEKPRKTGYLPGEVPLTADNKSQLCGLAVFRGGKMTGTLDSMEAQTYSMMIKGKTRKVLTLPDPLDPDSNIVVSVLPDGDCKIRSRFAGMDPVFDIEVNLHCTVECVQNETDYTTDENYGILTEYIRQTCIQNIRDLVSKMQKDYDVDILNLGDKLAHKFLTVSDWEAYNWPERYKDAEINIDVKLDIDRTGIFKP